MLFPPHVFESLYINYNILSGCFDVPGLGAVDVVSSGKGIMFDFGNVKWGWAPSGEPERGVLVHVGTRSFPDRPSPDHFLVVQVLVRAEVFGGARFLASDEYPMRTALEALHTEFETAPEAAQGLIPMVKLVVESVTLPTTKRTYYRPKLKIEGWVERPADLGPRRSPAPAPKVEVLNDLPQEEPVDQVERLLPVNDRNPREAELLTRLAEQRAAVKTRV